MQGLSDWLARFSANYAFLRRVTDSAGRALALQPYDFFLELGQELSFSETVDGIEVHFEVDVFREDKDGTLWVHMDARAQLWTPLGIKPSFVFRKLPDGTAYVG